MCLKIFQGDPFQCGRVGRFQVHRGSHSTLERVSPASDAKAPAIADLKTRKAPFFVRCDKVVAVEDREIQKVSSRDHADGMQANVLRTRAAEAIAIKPGHRISATRFEICSEHVGGHGEE
jgi:hypothetical protein